MDWGRSVLQNTAYGAALVVLRISREFGVAGHARQESTRTRSDGHEWKSNRFRKSLGSILREVPFDNDFDDRIHHGWLHRKEAGPARHSRRLSGDTKSLGRKRQCSAQSAVRTY